jgi:hypothetical protein
MTSKLPTLAEVTRLPKANLLGKERSLPTPTTPTSLKTNPPDCSLKASNKTKNNKKKKFIKTDTLHPSHEPISCLDTDPSLDTALRGLDLSLLLTHITPGVQTNPSLMTRQQMILARRLPLFNFPSTLYQPPPVLPPRRIPPTLDCCHDTDLPSYDPPDDTPVASGTAIGSLDDTLVDPLVFPVPTQPEQLSPYSPWPSDLPPYEPPYVRTPLPHEDPDSPPYDPPTDPYPTAPHTEESPLTHLLSMLLSLPSSIFGNGDKLVLSIEETVFTPSLCTDLDPIRTELRFPVSRPNRAQERSSEDASLTPVSSVTTTGSLDDTRIDPLVFPGPT